MSHNPIITAIDQVAGDNLSQALPTLEAFSRSQPVWVTPVAALAQAAENIGDWSSAFELWTQARRIAPQSEAVNEGVRRAALGMANPERATDETVSQSETDSPPVSPLADEHHAEGEEKVRGETVEFPETSSGKESPSRTPETESTTPRPLIEPFDFDITDLASPASTLSSTDSSNTLDELDNLIDRLEGARIVPREDAEKVPPPDLNNDVDDMVSETLATIYLNQQQFGEAARVFDRLAEMHPDRADEFASKADDARTREADQAKK